MESADFTRYVKAMKHLAETANFGNLPDSLSRYASMRILGDDIIELADQISDEERSQNHNQGIKKLNLAVSIFKEAALSGHDSDRRLKDRIRAITENLDKFLCNTISGVTLFQLQ